MMGRGSCSNGGPGRYARDIEKDDEDSISVSASYLDSLNPLEWDECIDPLTILPEQFFYDPRPSSVSLWLRKLMMAMLIDVIRLLGPRSHQGRAPTGTMRFIKQRVKRKQESKAAIREARMWVAKEDNDYVFSFVNVCEVLSLNAEAMRKYLFRKERGRLGMGRPIST